MEQTLAIFAASLAAVAALVWLAHVLGFSAPARVAHEDAAREALALVPGGFAPESLALDAAGGGALARDGAGRIAVVVPHGGRLVARVLGEEARLEREGEDIVVTAPELGAGGFRLRLPASESTQAGDWARSSPPAS